MDIEVSKLKIMKADHNSKQFRLEDSLLKYFPEKIEEHKGLSCPPTSDLKNRAADGFIHRSRTQFLCSAGIGAAPQQA